MGNLIGAFLRDWRTTGSIAPSSRFLVNAMLAPVDMDKARLLVEFGPGTGCITEKLLAAMHPDARLVAVEINPVFVSRLRERLTDARLTVVEGSAADLPQILADLGLGGADAVLSGLPFLSLPRPLREDIVRATAAGLAPGGRFIAFQYSPLVLPRLLRRHFGNMSVKPVLINLPPALVMTSVARGRGAGGEP